MIRTVIIDDEQHCIDHMVDTLDKYAKSSVTVVAVASSVEEGIAAIKKHEPGLVFLDVKLQNKTGFDLLEAIDNKNFEIIFVTAFDQYAVRAFRWCALDYLLKPVEESELLSALNKVVANNDQKLVSQKLELLLENVKAISGTSNRICLQSMTGFEFLQVSQIVRCQSNINYTNIFLADGRKLVIAKTLKEFETMLAGYNFFRVHNSHLVNLSCIKSYNKGKGGFITMTDNSIIDVSTRKKDEFLRKINIS